MTAKTPSKDQKLADCLFLYIKYGGRHHERIEAEMRILGYSKFSRRILYTRNERGRTRPGWIETHNWRQTMSATGAVEVPTKSEPPASAGGTKLAVADVESSTQHDQSAQRSLHSTAGAFVHPRRHKAKPGVAYASRRSRGSAAMMSGRAQPFRNAPDNDNRGYASIRGTAPNSCLESPSSAGKAAKSNRQKQRRLRKQLAKSLADGAVLSRAATTDHETPQSELRNPKSFHSWLKRVSPGMTWDWKYQKHIYERLQQVTDGSCKRLMIFLPPRHGKSELVTVRYSAWRIKQQPSTNIILGSYNQHLANRFSRKIRGVLFDDAVLSQPSGSADGVKSAVANIERFRQHDGLAKGSSNATSKPPVSGSDSYRLRPFASKNTEAEWETSEGGGVRAAGVGSGVTGFGANLIIIDDPVKNRAEAESLTYRDKIWDWFNDDLYTRLEPNGAIILIQTRWHEDDLAGRLLKEMREDDGEHWEVIDLPALAEPPSEKEVKKASGENKALSLASPPPPAVSTKPPIYIIRNGRREIVRSVGAPLPGYEYLDDIEYKAAQMRIRNSDSGIRNEKAEDKTNPQSEIRNPQWTDILGRTTGEALCPERYPVAALEKLRQKLGSYSFASLYQQRPVPSEGGLFKRAWFINNIVSEAPPGLQWKRGWDLGITSHATSDYTATARLAFDGDGNLYISDVLRARLEYPDQRRVILGRIEVETNTEHGIELSANGHAVLDDLRREDRLRGRSFRGVKVDSSKVTRALPWIALAEEGRIFLVRGPWNHEFIDEACSFPSGTHDDQVDAVSIAVSLCRRQKNTFYAFD